MTLQVGPARAGERVDAFHLFFQQVPEEERPARVDRGLALMAGGQTTVDGLMVCRADGRLVGVMVALPLQGAAALVWAPQALDRPDRAVVEDQLIDFTTAWLRERGCKFAQALLSPEDLDAAEPLRRHGFRHITTLRYLERDQRADDALDETPGRLRCVDYLACDPALFQATLLRSYLDTLDCPELNDVRTGAEVIAGYRAVPGCRLDRWWLAWQADQPVGVLITAELQGMSAWELMYVGLVPEARGQGRGRELTRWALHAAWNAGVERMTLTVDARNEPAQRLYTALGFAEFDRRAVLLRVFQ